MSNIKILDCTLRDGGYVNNWDFGYENIKSIIQELINANLDYIECGFFKDFEYNKNKSIFNSTINLENFLQTTSSKYTLMINYGEISLDKIPQNSNIIFRIAFKKENRYEALDFCKKIKDNGNNIFINPMYTNSYSTTELLELVDITNSINPHCFTIVDTAGAMKEQDLLSTFFIINNNLKKGIAICFHSHNNLKLSFSNAQALIKVCRDRELIIDSTVFGMGRAAGNLCTEVITQHLNDNYNGNYNLVPILKILNEQINPIFKKTPWGYSVPYYLAAINSCHPNYAKFLTEKQVEIEKIDKILKSIPENKKDKFDESVLINL